ncbi:hypothetical protein [Azospirillum sp. sgz301742]
MSCSPPSPIRPMPVNDNTGRTVPSFERPAEIAPASTPADLRDEAIDTTGCAILIPWPDRLPVLPEEVAVVRGWLGDLLTTVLSANDNQS